MANNFIPVVHRKEWAGTAPVINAHAAGMGIGCDLRTHGYAHPWILQLASATILNKYHIVNKAWGFVSSPALAGTFGAGAGCVFAPSMGLTGSVGAGCTTTSVVHHNHHGCWKEHVVQPWRWERFFPADYR